MFQASKTTLCAKYQLNNITTIAFNAYNYFSFFLMQPSHMTKLDVFENEFIEFVQTQIS